MQHIFIELWKFKDSWRNAGIDARAMYVQKLAPVVEAVVAAGVEIIAWGYNDPHVDRRADYDVFGVYRMPNRALFEQFQKGVADSGWYEYFWHSNAGGIAMTPAGVLGDHVVLAPPRVYENDISADPTGERHRVKVDGLEMSTLVLGQGRPIVFLHGDAGQAYMWRNVTPYAAKHGRAIAVDLIGMGESEKLARSFDGAYSFDTHYRFLDKLLAELGITQDVIFVANDWGANLAFEWAMRHPEAVAGVAYCEPVTPPFSWDDWNPMVQPLFRGLQSDQGEAMQLEHNAFVEALPQVGVLRGLSPAELDMYRRPYRNPGEDRRPALDWPREVPLGGRKPEMAARIEAHSEWMAESRIPKLFLRGEPGGLTLGTRLERLRQWKNQQEVTVKGLHWLPEDDPHSIGRALEEWLASR